MGIESDHDDDEKCAVPINPILTDLQSEGPLDHSRGFDWARSRDVLGDLIVASRRWNSV